ncbi:Protein of unknown function DUF2306, membrane [Cellulomonas flavigena DSM 20109]|uniref:Uncharacterized protein n=1 Tax=Cellulomonas flavigena (strain ATCC 482 / DSM 20109 / BCRC 11376 / JCM 18109 / NBRC 3775 / NCIMB 8073 / NRS 134) TaxID=446466 RepID=D5UGJ9_CELFN|nr:DUF2306 domain-containing protein [Cellulomonas flavigena]ADG73182.1 Protein of unknown function DUF2306, membrane [Cellulomonas flavigena DSM 20109]
MTTTAPPRIEPPADPAVRRRRVGLGVVAFLALGVTLTMLSIYGSASLDELAADDAGLAGAYAVAAPFFQGALYVHIVTACVALALGPLQFVARLRRSRPRLHRGVGRTYLGAVALGAVSGLAILPVNSAGLVGVFGFGALAVLWLVTGYRALRAIRGGDVATHQAWMIRSYALTFAAVTLRLWLGLLMGAQLALGAAPDAAFANAYAAVPFLCWLPNLVVAEALVRRRGLPSYALPAT